MSVQDLLTRKQVLFIIGVNAVLSALISLIVALIVIRPARVASAPTSTVAATETRVTAAVTPSPTALVHVIQSGDTISGLALRYDVPEADIIAANELENPNFLQVGMELIIPIGGVPRVTPTWTPQPTPTDTPIPFLPPSADMTATALAVAGVTVTPLPAAPTVAGSLAIQISQVVAPGNADREAVVITNAGNQLADMQGWTLSDGHGNTYRFPNFRLWPGGSLTLNTRIGQDGSPPANLFWGKLEPVWSAGEEATLKDATGAVVATYTVRQ